MVKTLTMRIDFPDEITPEERVRILQGGKRDREPLNFLLLPEEVMVIDEARAGFGEDVNRTKALQIILRQYRVWRKKRR